MTNDYRYNKFSLIFKCPNNKAHLKYTYVHHTNGHWLFNLAHRKLGCTDYNMVVFIYCRKTLEYLGFLSMKRGHDMWDLKHFLESYRC